MCLRVFVSTATPLERIALEPAAPLHVLDLRDGALSVQELLGGSVAELGAHTGCACGFAASSVTFGTDVSNRSEFAALEAALTEDERAEWSASNESLRSAIALVRKALADGPVRLYACWWGAESDPVRERRTVTLDTLAESTEPFEEHVLLEVTR